MPQPLLAALFSAMIVGATASIAKMQSFPHLVHWLLYIYLVGYRTKIFLDDLHYYEDAARVKTPLHWDLLFGMVSWVLWIALAISLSNVHLFVILLIANFGWSEIWILLDWSEWRKAIVKLPEKDRNSAPRTHHQKWLWWNLVPVIVGVLLLSTAPDDTAWESWPGAVYGAIALLVAFVLDAGFGYKYMLKQVER